MSNNFSSAFILLTFFAFNAVAKDNLSIESLECLGAEPFWGLSVKGETIFYSDIDDQTTSFTLGKVIASVNHNNRWVIQGSGLNGEAVSITLAKTHQCSDDMSDFVYEYDVMFSVGDKYLYSGCCNRINK
ncbi:hypothetical protein [Agarivorans sp. DSG3-1]|uniref:hypothetical protein n=1 Tax=Agarivorans sp. DSG3-1 TaxID=3342249 RepID=UPI00398F2EEC